MRAGQVFGGLVHLSLGAYALNLVLFARSPNSKAGEQKLVRLFSLPFGDWLVAVVGLSILIFGVSQFFIAWREDLPAFHGHSGAPPAFAVGRLQVWLDGSGSGLRFDRLFLLEAAFKHSPREAGGFLSVDGFTVSALWKYLGWRRCGGIDGLRVF